MVPSLFHHRLHALDAAPTEHAFRPDHQDQDHQHVRCEVFGAAADIRIEIAGGEIFDDADDQPADDGAHDRVETAQNYDRENPEADQCQLVVDADDRTPD